MSSDLHIAEKYQNGKRDNLRCKTRDNLGNSRNVSSTEKILENLLRYAIIGIAEKTKIWDCSSNG